MTHLAVCGLGRCGSSAVMHMLHEGGVPVLGEWPDYEPATIDTQELREGHAGKVLDLHRTELRPKFAIWLDRDLKQQAISGLRFVGMEPHRHAVRALMTGLRRDRAACRRRLERYGTTVFELSFERVIEEPSYAAGMLARAALAALGVELDAMRAVAAVHDRTPLALSTPWEARVA